MEGEPALANEGVREVLGGGRRSGGGVNPTGERSDRPERLRDDG